MTEPVQLEWFDGETAHDADRPRLTTQLHRVREAMLNPRGRWWTLAELQEVAGGSQAGISARIRDLRKERFGGYDVHHERLDGGLWRYRIPPPLPWEET